MEQDQRIALARLRLEQAHETLDDARAALRVGMGSRTVVNRAYYAAFYAVLGLLQLAGIVPAKHKGVLAAFDKDYVKTGVFPKEHSRALHRLFDLRLDGDYVIADPPTLEEAEDAVEDSAQFVSSINAYLVSHGMPEENK